MEGLSWALKWAPDVIPKVLMRGGKRSREEVGSMTVEAEVGVMRERGHQPGNSGSLQKLEKTRKRLLPWSLWEKPALQTP